MKETERDKERQRERDRETERQRERPLRPHAATKSEQAVEQLNVSCGPRNNSGQ